MEPTDRLRPRKPYSLRSGSWPRASLPIAPGAYQRQKYPAPADALTPRVYPAGHLFGHRPLESGLKSDANDLRNKVPRFDAENRKANQALVEVVENFAKQKNATPAQVALAWVLAQKP